MTRIEIDAYSDFVCPSCFIGSRCLRAALESFGRTGVVTRHLPYLLSPNVSDDGIDLRASLAQRYRKSPERLFEPFELKYPSAFSDTHLGRIGQAASAHVEAPRHPMRIPLGIVFGPS